MTFMDDWDVKHPERDRRWQVMNLIEERRYAEAVALIQELGGLACMQSRLGDSILHDVAGRGPVTLLEGLLACATKEQVNGRDSDQQTPLALAVCEDNVEGLVALLRAGADPDPDDGFWTPLLVAVANGQLEAAQALLASGADPNRRGSVLTDTPLCSAAHKNKFELVACLLAAGADPNLESDDITPLGYAAEEKHVDVVVALLHAGAESDRRDVAGNDYTPLCRAVKNRQPEIAAHLVRAGADPDAVCWMGTTPRREVEGVLSRRPGDGVMLAIARMFDAQKPSS